MRKIGFAAMFLLGLVFAAFAQPGPAAEAPAVEPAVEITAEPSHHLVLENDRVRVFRVEVPANTATLLHRHRHDYLFVTLGDSRIANEVEGRAPVEVTLADGETRFTPGDFAHKARDLADRPFRNITVELVQDEKLREQPSPWPEAAGDLELPGVRQKVLFVKDGARVSEVTLQPGAKVPSHHHDGPHLMVAVSDLELLSDIEGRGPIAASFKAGDVKWLPGGFTHSLTNTGKSPARMVTVEFKP